MRLTVRIGWVLLLGAGVASAGCDSLLGIDLTFVDAASGPPDVGVSRDGGAKDARADGTTSRDSGGTDARQDARDAPTEIDSGHPDALACSPTPSLASDPSNCGRCGHDCIVGSCVEGRCQPVAVAGRTSSTAVPNFLVVQGGKVFWAQGGGAMSDYGAYYAPTTGGQPVPVTVNAQSQPAWGIQTDGHFVFLGFGSQGVWFCPYPACSSGPDGGILQLAGTNYNPPGVIPFKVNGLALGPDVLWITSNSTLGGTNSGGSLTRCTAPEQAATCTVVINQTVATANSPVVDDGGILFVAEGSDTVPYTSGSINVCGGTCAQNTNAFSPQYLALDGTRIYWTEWTSNSDAGVPVGRVQSCPRDKDCAVSEVTYVTGLGDPAGIVSDGVFIYWADMKPPAILACPVAGCPDAGPIVLANDAGAGVAPFQVAVDDAGVYWTDMVEAGAIMRVAKP